MPSLANCRFHTLAPGFLEGFSVRHLSVCAVNAVVPDDPQKELVVRPSGAADSERYAGPTSCTRTAEPPWPPPSATEP